MGRSLLLEKIIVVDVKVKLFTYKCNILYLILN